MSRARTYEGELPAKIVKPTARRSSRPPRRSAARTPSGTPRSKAKTIPPMFSVSVMPTLEPIARETDWPVMYDWPRLKWNKTLRNQCQYCS